MVSLPRVPVHTEEGHEGPAAGLPWPSDLCSHAGPTSGPCMCMWLPQASAGFPRPLPPELTVLSWIPHKSWREGGDRGSSQRPRGRTLDMEKIQPQDNLQRHKAPLLGQLVVSLLAGMVSPNGSPQGTD